MIVTLPDGTQCHVSVGGPTLRIEVDGKTYPFEHHPQCGPCPLNKRGDPKELGPRHRFWHAVSCWSQRGSKTDDTGLAAWTEPPHSLAGCVRIGRDWFPRAMAERLYPGIPVDEEVPADAVATYRREKARGPRA